ncbi:MAG: M20/M25/M40 family metallo-hydrolase, partial [Phycisphaerae bacterium]|nr:M20/M25/M40 family metallo-hydrolase [Phycisphaerae bacterium]
ERDGQRVWLDYVRANGATSTWNDAYGNCFAALEPTGPAERPAVPGPAGTASARPFTVAVCGHADEIGLMVNHIDTNGFVFCRQIGGIDPASIVGKRIQFRSSVKGVGEPVLGLVGATAIHLQDRTGDAKVRKLHELFIDIGAKDEAGARARLNIGDAGVFSDASMMMDSDVIVARALDNRVGTWVAAETLRLCAQMTARHVRVVAVSTVQEEVGCRGARMVADSLHPNVALVTDVGHATDSPGITQAQHGQFKLGAGPKLAVGGGMQPEVVARLAATAERLNISLQRSATPGSSGTDTDAIFPAGGGIPSGLISLPIRYMHTTVEMARLSDLDQIPQVFAGFCEGLKADHAFAPSL